MPQHYWICEDKVTNAAALPVVHIATADARLFYMNSDIVLVAETRDVSVFE